MKHVIKYYKPFLGIIIISIILLGIQAVADLKLPDKMSYIVNVGIQASGIEEISPKAISEEGMQLMQTFMPEEDKELINTSYKLVNKGDSNYTANYPKVQEKNIYVLENNDNLELIDNAFATASQAFILTMQKFKTPTDVEVEDNSTNFDLSKLNEILPMIKNIPTNQLAESIAVAKMQSIETTSQMAKVFTKAFYEELGVNVSDVQMNYIVKVGLEMLGIAAIGITAAIIVDLLAARIGAGIGRDLRKKVFEKVESFSNTEFNRFSAASLITRTTNDITQIQNLTVMGIRLLVYSPIMGIGAMMLMLNKTTNMIWILGLGCGLIILFTLILFVLVLPKIKIIQKLTDRLNLVFKENLSGMMVIRAFGTQKYEEDRFDTVNTDVANTNKFVARSLAALIPVITITMNLISILIIWVGAHQIAEATIQVGDLMAMLQYAIQVIMSFLMVSMVFIMLPRAFVSAGRIAEVLTTENSIKEPEKPKKFIAEKLGYVEFKNVTFQYENAEHAVLKHVTFTAKPGETTAFIGSTGSGKSTIVKLIPRLFDVTEGEVLVNGVNVKELSLHDLHSQIGYVPQRANLLSGTIKENLKYGNKKASDKWMETCVEIAQATDFINEKEEKYDYHISQGSKNVSGGQRQRLSIARALTTEAPILIFDDSFSALDFKTDSKLRAALREHNKYATVLIVAQRVSTIMNAEQIIVLDNEKIVGMGNHEELMKNCDVYREIVHSQLSETEVEG